MDEVGSHWSAPLGRPTGPKRAIADFVEIAAMLIASAALALLVAAAGSALPDAPTDAAPRAEVPAVPRLNILEFCSGEAEQRRCIEEET